MTHLSSCQGDEDDEDVTRHTDVFDVPAGGVGDFNVGFERLSVVKCLQKETQTGGV